MVPELLLNDMKHTIGEQPLRRFLGTRPRPIELLMYLAGSMKYNYLMDTEVVMGVATLCTSTLYVEKGELYYDNVECFEDGVRILWYATESSFANRMIVVRMHPGPCDCTDICAFSIGELLRCGKSGIPMRLRVALGMNKKEEN